MLYSCLQLFGIAKKATVISAIIVTAISTQAVIAQTAPGVLNDRIVFGQTAALGGPAAALGTGMQAGLLVAFAEANANGGVGGRQIELVSYDDGYEPDAAIANTRKLIEEDNVFALIGAVGTPTSRAIQPITTELGVPFVGPFTGAGFLRDAALRNVINVRGTYAAETEMWVGYLADRNGINDIALMYQNDGFGRAGLSGITAALDKRGLSLVAEGTYQRNTTAVRSGLLAIRRSNPGGIATVGAYQPVAEFIKLARRLRVDAPIMNISFTGSRALADALMGEDIGDVFVTQVVPFPEDTSIPIVADYVAAMSAYDADREPGFVSLEGYLVGRLAVAVLANITGDVTRDSFIETVYRVGKFDFGGKILTYGPSDNQGSDEIYLTKLGADGSYTPIEF